MCVPTTIFSHFMLPVRRFKPFGALEPNSIHRDSPTSELRAGAIIVAILGFLLGVRQLLVLCAVICRPITVRSV